MDTKKYLELCERAETGEKVSKDDWDMDYIIDTVMELVDEYDFDWDKQVLVPQDDKLLDDMFAAAKKMILTTGVYNMSTGRIIRLRRRRSTRGSAT